MRTKIILIGLISIFLLSVQSIIGHDKKTFWGSRKLIRLPAGATNPSGKEDKTKLLKSVSNQVIRVEPGENFTFEASYHLWAPRNPREIDQLFFIASWTPRWPPPRGFYAAVYHGIPGLPPGRQGKTTVTFKAPNKPGVYYLWFGSSAHYSVRQGVAGYRKPLKPPAHIKVIVGDVPDDEDPNAPTYITCYLKDASIIRGRVDKDFTIIFSTMFGRLKIPLKRIINIKRGDVKNEEKDQISTIDGSTIVGWIKNNNITIDTGYGVLTIPFEKITKIE
jgi:hypothetical protein